jgi:hypothetical protein
MGVKKTAHQQQPRQKTCGEDRILSEQQQQDEQGQQALLQKICLNPHGTLKPIMAFIPNSYFFPPTNPDDIDGEPDMQDGKTQ